MMSAAETRGQAAAAVVLPDLPADCRTQERHDLKAGDEAITALKKQRRAIDRANRRVLRCAGFYDDTKRKIERR